MVPDRHSLLRVIAVDRLKCRNLDPLGEQVGSGRSRKAANVRAAERKSAQAQTLSIGLVMRRWFHVLLLSPVQVAA